MVTNVLPVTQLVARTTLPDFVNNLGMVMCAKNYDKFDGQTTQGTTINESYPMQFAAVNSLDYNLTTQQNEVIRRIQPITLDIPISVPFTMTAQEMTFASFAENQAAFRSDYTTSAAVAAANEIDIQVIQKCEKFWPDSIGDPTTNLSGINTLALVQTQFANMGLQDARNGNDLYAALSPDAYNNLQIPYATYFNEEVNLPILRNGRAGYQYGVNIFQDVNVSLHTNGTFDAPGNVQVATTVPTTNSINDAFTLVDLKGFTPSATGVLNVGDLIYFGVAGNFVNAVTPKSYKPYANPKKFYVMGNATGGPNIDADGSGLVTIQVYSPIVATDPSALITTPWENVSRQVVLNDVVNLVGAPSSTYRKNFCFLRDGFRVANPPIATYPLGSGGGGSQPMSAYPSESIAKMTIPGNDLRVAINVATGGQIQTFAVNFAMRSLAGALPFNGYGFTLLSAV